MCRNENVKHIQLPLTERQAIAVHRCLLPSTTCHIVEGPGAQGLASLLLEKPGVRGHGGQDIVQRAIGVDLLLIQAIILRHFGDQVLKKRAVC